MVEETRRDPDRLTVMASIRYSTPPYLTIPNLILIIAIITVAIVAVKSHEEEWGASRGGFSDDDDDIGGSREPVWEPVGKCRPENRERCCRLRARITRDGSIQVNKPRCPAEMIHRCCASARKVFNLDLTSLQTVIDCISHIIANLLEFKLKIEKDSKCCNIPIFKKTCEAG